MFEYNSVIFNRRRSPCAFNCTDSAMPSKAAFAGCLDALHMKSGPGKERIADLNLRLYSVGCSLTFSQASYVMDCIN